MNERKLNQIQPQLTLNAKSNSHLLCHDVDSRVPKDECDKARRVDDIYLGLFMKTAPFVVSRSWQRHWSYLT